MKIIPDSSVLFCKFAIVRLCIALTAVIIPAAAPAEWPPQLDISGSTEYLLTYNSLSETRLNPGNALNLPHYTGIIEGRLTISTGITPDSRSGMQIEPRVRYDYVNNDFEPFIDQAYINVRPYPIFLLRAGRQRIGFGTGYIWSAVNDLDVLKDVYLPGKYSQGVNALRTTLDLAPVVKRPLSVSIEAVLPENAAENGLSASRAGIQFYTLTGPLELGASASFRNRKHADDDFLTGAYASLDIAGFIAGAEASLSRRYQSPSPLIDRDCSRIRPMAVIGLNRMLSGRTFSVIEYAYNGHALTSGQFDTMTATAEASPSLAPLALSQMIPGYTGRHNAFGTVSWDLSGQLALQFSALARLDRPGGFIYPAVSWLSIENLVVTIEALVMIHGKQDNEYRLGPISSNASLRLAYYF